MSTLISVQGVSFVLKFYSGQFKVNDQEGSWLSAEAVFSPNNGMRMLHRSPDTTSGERRLG